MAIVTPGNKSVLDYKGIHVYHMDISNCSGRVRLVLEEKGLPWEDHHIDLRKKANIIEAKNEGISDIFCGPWSDVASSCPDME